MQVALNRQRRQRGVPLSPQQVPGQGEGPSLWIFAVFDPLFIPCPQVSLSPSSPTSPSFPGCRGGEDAQPWLSPGDSGQNASWGAFGGEGRSATSLAGEGSGMRPRGVSITKGGGVPLAAAPPQ